MQNREQRIRRARDVLQIEAETILSLKDTIGEEFVQLVEMILSVPGKVVISGVGKSGLVGRKIAATMCSTGTPAVYLDSTDALHGDLGVVASGDVLIAISNSGEATELLNVITAARAIGAKIAAITGNPESSMAESADITLPVCVQREACPLGLAPTASTTAVLAVGDALAMVLMEAVGFTSKHYARFHPGGSLGQRLKLRVCDIMLTGETIPLVNEADPLQKALEIMSSGANLGVVLVADADGRLAGILTDGDVRRLLMQHGKALNGKSVGEVMKPRPMTIDADATASEAVRVMEKGTGRGSITSLAVVDTECRPVGLIHLHDILGRGKFMI